MIFITLQLFVAVFCVAGTAVLLMDDNHPF